MTYTDEILFIMASVTGVLYFTFIGLIVSSFCGLVAESASGQLQNQKWLAKSAHFTGPIPHREVREPAEAELSTKIAKKEKKKTFRRNTRFSPMRD